MISISDAARFSEESHATRKFKPWWETVVDYLIISLLILTLFSWAKVVTAEASGLLCIPVDPKIGYSYNLAKYFNSRCAQEFKDKVLLHYPYLLFFQWLLLSVFQKLWLKLPVVQNKFETFVELFKLLKETTKIDTTTSIGNDIWEVNRIDQVFNERSFLSILYTAKGFLITFSSASASCLLIAWISTLDFYKSDFECSLSLIYSPANNLVCNFQPVQYIYISIFCNVAIQLSITCISLYACYYSLTRKWEKHYRMSNSLRRYKAFKDLCFCVCFLKTSLQERQTILHALCRYATQSQNDVMATESRDYSVVKYVCDYLGLTIMESSDENSLENIGKQLNGKNKQHLIQVGPFVMSILQS